MTFGRASRLGAVLAALALTAACGGGDSVPELAGWAQWRGPGGLGISPEAGLPRAWSRDSPNLRWLVQLPGRGNSSPVVFDGIVYVTSSLNREGISTRMVSALDMQSGEPFWSTEIARHPQQRGHWLNTLAASTPVTDGERLYVKLGGFLAALDLDGNVLWKIEADPLYEEYFRYGAATSLVLADGKVVFAMDREDTNKPTGWIAAYDTEDGSEAWRVEWDDDCCSYSTPLVLTREGATELVFYHGTQVAAYDPSTGEGLWSFALERVQPVPSLVYENGLLAVVGGQHHTRSSTVIRLSGSGRETRVEELWTEKQFAPKTGSPILIDGRLYQVADGGVVSCRDAASGEVLWTGRLATGKYRSSPVAGDGKLYVPNTEGVTSVLALGTEFELLAENDLGDGSNASPAIAEGCLLLRSKTHLACIEREATPG